MSEMRSMMDYALEYVGCKFSVFPLHSVNNGDCSCGRDACSSVGKHPRTKNGVKDATLDVRQVQRWWQQWPEANIGIATGDGLHVIDVDCVKGGTLESLLELDIPGVAWTLTAHTGSGGYHLYLSCGELLANTANKLAQFVDTRGEGGYVVAPPSRNKNGAYSWCTLTDVQPLPAKALNRLKAPAAAVSKSPVFQSILPLEPEEQAPARSEQQPASASVAAEARNNYLIKQAGALRGDGFTAEEICGMLQGLNEARYGAGKHPQGPLALDEMQRTIFKSVAKWEQDCGLLVPAQPQIQRMSDLLAMDLPPVPWIVPDLLAEGLTLLAGKPKVGKSWLILGLAIICALGSVKAGRKVLGRYPVEPMGVFYLSLEDHAARLRMRTAKMLTGCRMPDTFGLSLRWKPLQSGGFEDLEKYLLSVPDTRLVIIDTLARVRLASSSNNNAYQEDSALMGRLQHMATDHHLAIVVVHHLRKMSGEDVFDEISGSLGLTGSADTSIILKRDRYQNDGTLHITGRDIEEQELAATFAAASGYWSIAGSAEEHQASSNRRMILDLLKEKGAMTPVEVARELGKTGGTIRTTLARLAQDGWVIKRGTGKYELISAKRDIQVEKGEQSEGPEDSLQKLESINQEEFDSEEEDDSEEVK